MYKDISGYIDDVFPYFSSNDKPSAILKEYFSEMMEYSSRTPLFLASLGMGSVGYGVERACCTISGREFTDDNSFSECVKSSYDVLSGLWDFASGRD